MDAYSLIKVLVSQNPEIVPKIVMNRCDSEAEAQSCTRTLINAAKQFLNINSISLGWLPVDSMVTRSLKDRYPLLLAHPQQKFSRHILQIAQALDGHAVEPSASTSGQSFWDKLRNRLRLSPL